MFAFTFAVCLLLVAIVSLACTGATNKLAAPACLLLAVWLGGMLGGTYAPNENPIALNERAHAMSIASMHARQVDWNFPDALTAEQDRQTRAWLEHARTIDLR